ncbi:MAG: 4-alpha-glucanotransferase [Nitrospirales bacterium]|nr:4-alpha-glucanotransferase [Nitrospira sp.]MDR4499891.1 4-alpha-glucanotransferase [Nitrospirales bacterium]
MPDNSSVQFDDVRRLADYFGLASSYTDGVGVTRTIRDENLTSVLEALGIPVRSSQGVAQHLREAENHPWRQLVDEVIVLPDHLGSSSIDVSLPVESGRLETLEMTWTITDEQNRAQTFQRNPQPFRVLEAKRLETMRYVRVALSMPCVLGLGYYRMSLDIQVRQAGQAGNQHASGETFLIVAPSQCYLPRTPSRSVGLSVQLYNVRTAQNWGIGDFRDLESLMRWGKKHLDVSTIGLNPLHAPSAGLSSPYSPSSRLYFNPIYLNLEGIPEFRSTPSCQRRFHSARFQKALQELRTSHLVQYDRVREIKSEMLGCLYKAFERQHVRYRTARFRTFERYCRTQGKRLEQYCAFQVLSERFKTANWRQWPTDYQRSTSQVVRDVLDGSQERFRFFQYVQWQCEEQLSRLDRLAKRLKLSHRLYHDLPVGVHPDGADAWIFQDELALGVTLGAPPDSFNLQGQNWGLMAPIPWRMRVSGYQFFLETIRRNMQYGGMLRIDHALGLFRLFMIPEGCPGEAGTYVKTRIDEILAILALESVRNHVMVVGEDLGVVTQEIRDCLAKAGILSYRIMPFEKTQMGKWQTPKHYPKQAIVSFTTHDLPTFRGYWAGRDIEVKAQAALYPSEQHIECDWETRMKDRIAFIQAMVKANLLPKSAVTSVPLHAPETFLRAAYAYLARSRCRVVMIPLEDIVGELDAPNLPGATHDAYPSWKIKLRRSFEEFKKDPRIGSTMKAVHAEQQGNRCQGRARKGGD